MLFSLFEVCHFAWGRIRLRHSVESVNLGIFKFVDLEGEAWRYSIKGLDSAGKPHDQVSIYLTPAKRKVSDWGLYLR
jgi:hypothetical protein